MTESFQLTKNQSLRYLISAGEVSAIQRYLELGVDPNQQLENGETPLSLCLHRVAQQGEMSALKVLIRRGVKFQGTELEYKALASSLLCVKKQAAYQPEGEPDPQGELIKTLLKIRNLPLNQPIAKHDRSTLLRLAAKKRDFFLIGRLLAAGANINERSEKGETVLSMALDHFFATYNPDLKPTEVIRCICLLISRGAEVSCLLKFSNRPGFNDLLKILTPLFPFLKTLQPMNPLLQSQYCHSGFHRGLFLGQDKASPALLVDKPKLDL